MPETIALFSDPCQACTGQEWIGNHAVVLRGFALSEETKILNAIDQVTRHSPYRHMTTPGGYTMSVAMSNCGEYGWVSDKSGYRYDHIDPLSGKPWPAMPDVFQSLAEQAAGAAGFHEFNADVCLINQYKPGAKLSLHQDKDEQSFNSPIVSVSLGLSALFLFGGLKRKDKPNRIPLHHGDVVVWGGEDRLRYHGILPLKEAQHLLLGNKRINLTFRKAV